MEIGGMPLRDVAAGRVLVVCGGLALTVALVVGVVAGVLAWRGVPFDGARSATGERGVRGAVLQPAPQPDLARARAVREAATRTTAWVDRPAGLARIPVDTAMTLLSERGVRATAASEPSR